MTLIQTLLDVICNTLLDPQILEGTRTRKGAFTRNCGKLPYWTAMKLLLKNVKLTASVSLDCFFTDLANRAGIPISGMPHCSLQAFSKARLGIDHTIHARYVLYELHDLHAIERVLDVLCSPDSPEYHCRLGGLYG